MVNTFYSPFENSIQFIAGILQDIFFNDQPKCMNPGFYYVNGINNYVRDEYTHTYEHLGELLGFVLELQKSVDEFNQNLVLRIGFGDERGSYVLHRC